MTESSQSDQGASTNPLAKLAQTLRDVDSAEAQLVEPEIQGPVADVSSRPLAPERVGDYDLLECLGHGGQGAVYRARQRSLDKFVAVKVIAGQFAFDPTRVARFRAEPLAASKVQHPGIVSVHFVGEQNGIHYIAQELIEGGRTLAHLIKERRAAPPADHDRSMAELFAKVADALEAVHQAKLIHRDIKPGNILLTPQGEPKVADFGLARDLDAPGMSASDASPGTIEYMSPEQVDRKLGAVDARTDVYGLGVTLYEALTFSPWMLAASRLEAQRIILEEEMRDLRTIRAAVPIELSLLCRKAAEKEPRRRYQSMAEFAADLRRYLNHQPILAEPPSAARRAQLWARRNRVAAALIASSVVVATVSTGAAFKILEQNRRLGELRLFAERSADLARDDVLSLSSQMDLEVLAAEAEKLWPAHPDMIPAYEDWLRRANDLIDGRSEDQSRGLKRRPGLAEHKAKLAELRAHAKPLSQEQIQADRESHPKYAELQAKQAELLWRSRMLTREPWPSDAVVEAELATESLPVDADALNLLARRLVDPAKRVFGLEVRGLVLARRAVAASTEANRARIRETLAWALFQAGRFSEALRESRTALAEPGGDVLAPSCERLRDAVTSWRGDERALRRLEHEQLAEQVSLLAVQVGERRTYEFDDVERSWWHPQLVRLVHDLEKLRDPATGPLGDALAEPFGWGVAKRYAFAKSIGERSIDSPEAKRCWTEAIAAIKASPKYGKLEIVAQMGLIPIGMDPESGLWEFAHIQTGEPAVRGADGKLELTDETGLVLVLVPGGNFWMGAQNSSGDRNYDAQARENEGPVQKVELSPYFLSKYEMTQGQWRRLAAVNPSVYGPAQYFNSWSRSGNGWSSLHPVEQVSWAMCLVLMSRAGLSLPTEAQWECGARGGSSSAYWSGENSASLVGVANLSDSYGYAHGNQSWSVWERNHDDGHTVHATVGSFRANAFGLFDVHGNVWEWCLDGYGAGPYRENSGKDPLSPPSGASLRVARGGSFNDVAPLLRSAARAGYSPEFRDRTIGLRPARTVHTPPLRAHPPR
jgi:formylglycine-generating enzyme required for sulfatase activity